MSDYIQDGGKQTDTDTLEAFFTDVHKRTPMHQLNPGTSWVKNLAEERADMKVIIYFLSFFYLFSIVDLKTRRLFFCCELC